MSEGPVNPIYAQGDAQGVFHAGEAPPAGHAFHPLAHCGETMTGQRYGNRSDLPSDYTLCATDAKWLGIQQDTPASKSDSKSENKEAPKADS